jgi:hypothetical protein
MPSHSDARDDAGSLVLFADAIYRRHTIIDITLIIIIDDYELPSSQDERTLPPHFCRPRGHTRSRALSPLHMPLEISRYDYRRPASFLAAGEPVASD